MKMSITEVRDTATRAALSRRLAPELAETFTDAIVWLCAAGFDGMSTALLALGKELDEPGDALELRFSFGEWRAPASPALHSAPAVLGFLADEPPGRTARFEGPDAALLVLGCAGVLSREMEIGFAVECGGKEVLVESGVVTERPRGDLALAGVPVRVSMLGLADGAMEAEEPGEIEVFGPICEALDRMTEERAA